MTDSCAEAEKSGAPGTQQTSTGAPDHVPELRSKKRANMHDGIPVWYDCCSCEAEPYWVAAGAEAEAAQNDAAETRPDCRQSS